MQFCQPLSFRDLQVDMLNSAILIIAWDKIIVIIAEENDDIFLAGGGALVYLSRPMHKKNIPQHFFEAIDSVRTYLRTDFSPPCCFCLRH